MARGEQERDAYLPPMRSLMALPVLLLLCASSASSQQPAASPDVWRPGTTIDLIRRAAEHRAARDADTLLSAWQAEARGILRSASVLDHGAGPVERVIRTDELRVEVYGESPNQSKQIIIAWRDTSYLPNSTSYHRDHLGIVANDFGAMIRLGQGDEVRDVVHPLSALGLDRYEFALGDTVTLNSQAGRVRVAVVRVRPLHADSAGAIGTLYIDLDRAALVRFGFTFTPASYRDRTVEEITVTLDNALHQSTRWLPSRQSIMIRRGFAGIDLPVRTVIRADWTIDNYELGVHHPPGRFTGPPLVGPRVPMRGGTWDAAIPPLAALPAVDADVAAIERDAVQSLGGRLLDGLPRARLGGAGVSDFVRVNRVQGVTPAIGGRVGIGDAFVARGRIGFGVSDQRLVGSASLEHAVGSGVLSIAAQRQVRDVADDPVISGLANSIGTAISGDDFGDYVLRQSIDLRYAMQSAGIRAGGSIGVESARSVINAFTPLDGVARENPSLGRSGEWLVARLDLAHRNQHGFGWTLAAEAGGGNGSYLRFRGTVEQHAALPAGELLLHAVGGAGSGDLPAYRTFTLGGRGTLLGTPFRSLGGSRMALVEIAWAIPAALPTPPFPYSRWIRLPSVLAPYLAAGLAGGDVPGVPWRATGTVEAVAGVRLDLWGPMFRLDAGVSLRTGRVGFSVDAHPDWWGVL